MQKIEFRLGNEGRKGLVKAVGEILGIAPRYLGAPGFSYEIGKIIIDRDGVLNVPDDMNAHGLIHDLEERGFVREQHSERFAISLPADGFDERAMNNLRLLIGSKGGLIRKALGADSLTVNEAGGMLWFDWFDRKPTQQEHDAYMLFFIELCKAAKQQQRVTARPVPVTNEKYAFRCFLLKLGFIGDEYKNSRKILLSRLSGNSAFLHGKPQEEQENG